MLKVTLEQIRGDGAGRFYTIPRGTVRIGRKNTDIEITNERISSIHAEIHYSGTRVFIIDRNSTNGTFVNGRKIRRTPLKDGDVITLGGTGEKSAAVFKLNISGEASKIVYILNRSMDYHSKYLYIVLGLGLVLFFVWLLIPVSDPMSLKGGEKPWEESEEMLPAYGGTRLTIALNDAITPPPGGNWKSDVKYELTKDTDVYEPRIYIVDLWDDVAGGSSSDKVVQASITIQRFKENFVGNIDEQRIKSFIWHETKFLSENKIDKKFAYSKAPVGVWQWVIWQDETKFNLYASCVTKRGRILLQASAFDVYTIKRFFQYIANSYQEGSAPKTEPITEQEL
jgi:pSer/pThr/pTyr-binding forkhead associated (FHA) protein